MTQDTDLGATLIVPLVAGSLGLLLRLFMRPKTHKIGKRKWLKIMEPDLDFQGA